MREELISFETAKLAKEKHFDVTVVDCYWKNLEDNYYLNHDDDDYFTYELLKDTDHYAVPSQSLLQRWLREKHNILVFVTHKKFVKDNECGYYYHLGDSGSNTYYGAFDTYENALEIGLKDGLKLI